MNFDESEKYLYALGNEVLAMKLGLDSIKKLFTALGNPEKNFLKIQVAGTNGKGSTCAFLDSICVSAGVKTGLFTSPHLVSITERIKISGEEISKDAFARHATKIRNIAEELLKNGELETVPTFFEQITAMAISAFDEAKIELAILETGLGGRFDATTAANAEIAALTPIDFDHQNILGNSISAIAAEKAAIIHENSTVVSAQQSEPALAEILAQCRAENVEPKISDCQVFAENFPEISFKTAQNSYPHINLSLAGEHQRENACVAINVAEVLARNFSCRISRENVISGLESAKHPGRLEWWRNEMPQILFDGAHNAAGAQALKNYLEKYFEDSLITFVFGTMRDKNIREIAEILFPLAENLILTEPDNPRSEKVAELQKIAAKLIDESRIFAVENVIDAIDAAKQITVNCSLTKHSFVCVTGSLYLVGEAQKNLLEKNR